jgi:hypothetical protein
MGESDSAGRAVRGANVDKMKTPTKFQRCRQGDLSQTGPSARSATLTALAIALSFWRIE